ncbi:flagellar basal body L-ring protein FlgH [Salaquimonas pukyongi]|uniref:flagellar basal body L-ring protein FlgH n=1 Tax=Salaquimonas pukyongi TaxID=2712698 RepID=UPI0019680C77|nr:flagellar basal body L-ring protein FlgH [Salaquimonas pukyongi]
MSAVSTSEPLQQSLIQPEPAVIKASHRVEMEDNGIWNRQDAIYFRDTRAYRVGDILTVRILINDSARLNNRSDVDLEANGSVGLDFSGSLLNHDLSATDLGGNLDAKTGLAKGGTVNRAERIQLQIAASIIDASPNGNLLIRGSQEVRVNHQMRVLTVTGIVRAKDILPDNSIPYEKIAEARISYGGNNSRYVTERPRSFLARLTRTQ